MSWKYLSILITVGAALVCIFLERIFPYNRRQKLIREGIFNDLIFYMFIQSYVLSYIINAFIEWLDRGTGASRFHVVSGWPLWAQVVLFLVTHDFYIYCFHRAQHHSKYLWRIHEAHHSTKDVDWISGARSHSIEILINQTIEFAPIILLGAHPDVVFIKVTIDAIWGMYIHSNINVRSGVLQYIINGPEMHRWHHAIEITEGGINFSTKFAFWDWIFGTAYNPAHKPSGYGLSDVDFPKGYVAQHTFAFRKFSSSTSTAVQSHSTT